MYFGVLKRNYMVVAAMSVLMVIELLTIGMLEIYRSAIDILDYYYDLQAFIVVIYICSVPVSAMIGAILGYFVATGYRQQQQQQHSVLQYQAMPVA